MPDCNETLRELEAFLDSELSEETHLAIRSHLEGCPDCHQAFDFHAELKIVVAQKCSSDAMPAGLLAKLEACFGEIDGDLDDPLDDQVSAVTIERVETVQIVDTVQIVETVEFAADHWDATDELDAGPDGA